MFHTKNYRELNRLFFMFVIPAVSSQLLSGIYTIVDGYFVGWGIGQGGLAAIGLSFPFSVIVTAIGAGIGVGGGALIAISMGRGREALAQRILGAMVFLMIAASAVSSLLLTPLAEYLLTFYKVSPDIAEMARYYAWILIISSPAQVVTMAMLGAVRNDGFPRKAMAIMIAAFGTNIVLDWLWVIVFPFGIAGAAWATWISQAVVCGLFVYQLKCRNKLFGGFPFFVRLKERYTKRIFQLGLPVALLNTFFAIINLFMARTASTYGGHIGLMTLTAGGQMEAIAWNTSQGFSTALSAFTAQNYAARKKERILTAYHTTLKMTSIIGVLCTLLFVFYGSEVFSLIVPEQAAYEAGGIFLRIDGYSMIFMMLEITTQGMFYGTGRTVPPAIISISCNTLRIPLAIGLAAAGLGITGVWWAISLSSMLKGVVAFIWFSILQKKIL